MTSDNPTRRKTFQIHYKGKFVLDGDDIKYEGGERYVITKTDIDGLKHWDFRDDIEQLGYHESEVLIWYCPNDAKLAEGRRLVWDKRSLFEMYGEAFADGNVDVYLEHLDQVIADEIGSSQLSSYPTAELENDEEDDNFRQDIEHRQPDEHAADPHIDVHEEHGIADNDKDDFGSEENPDTDDDSIDEWFTFDKEKQKFPYQPRDTDYREVKLALMQVFNDREEFRDALFKYALARRCDIKYDRSAFDKLSAICTYDKCPWRVYAAKDNSIGKWMIKHIVHDHKCIRVDSISMLNYIRLGRIFTDKLRERQDYSATEMKNDVMRMFRLKVTKEQCRRARKYALDAIRGSYKEHFGKLWDYAEEIRRSNPGATVDIVTVTNRETSCQRFKRIYMSFPAWTKGWLAGCRPVIGLDGCFLKWIAKGQLLSAVGRDANNQIYPIAWAVVEVECKASWEWFIIHLKEDLRLTTGDGLALISDQQKGLLGAVDAHLPKAEHRMCARHIYSNWRKTNKEDIMKPLFWSAARSYTIQDFQRKTELIKDRSVPAFNALMRTSPEHWSRAYFNTMSCCDDVSNNMSESFNNTLRAARMKPIVDLLEDIRKMNMRRASKRLARSKNDPNAIVTPRVKYIIAENTEKAVECRVWSLNPGVYEVEFDGHSCRVDLGDLTCACRQWDLSGIPCCHAIAAIIEERKDPEKYVPHYHTVAYWQKAYETNIEAVNGERLWVKTGKDPIEPPADRVMPGRPKRNRTKDVHESPKKPGRASRHCRIVTCSHCWKIGHNKRVCPLKDGDGLSRPPMERRPKGRPKKTQPKVDPIIDLPTSQQMEPHEATPPAQPKRRRGRPKKSSAGGPSSDVGPSGSAGHSQEARPQKKQRHLPRGHGVLVTDDNRMFYQTIGGISRRID